MSSRVSEAIATHDCGFAVCGCCQERDRLASIADKSMCGARHPELCLHARPHLAPDTRSSFPWTATRSSAARCGRDSLPLPDASACFTFEATMQRTRASARAHCGRIGRILSCLLLVACMLLDVPRLTLEASSGPSLAHAALFPARVVTLRAPGAAMLRIPAGRFEMGSSLKAIMAAAELCQKQAPTQACRPQLFANEQPLHTVELSAFWLDRTEVTVEAYERCVAQRRCAEPPYVEGAARFRQPGFPVSLVTWDDARNYCRWRGARLPTEAEFERASRGVERRRFPWGELYNSHLANHGRYGVAAADANDGFEELAPVGSFPNGRTPDGFMDLAGNVAEWVFDRYAPRYPQASNDPRGPAASATNRDRVTRGGHFRSAPVWLRGAARDFHEPGERLPYLGFRCARSALHKDES